MTRMNGFGALSVVIIIAILLVVGGGAYIAAHRTAVTVPETATSTVATTSGQAALADHPEVNQGAGAPGKIRVDWKFEDAGEKDNIPYTKVSFNDQVVGTYQGTCAEIGAEGGVDGTGLLAGELSGVQCYFAGGGDEIGLFAKEDGGTEIMVGSIQEPVEGSDGFRGDFQIRTDLHI